MNNRFKRLTSKRAIFCCLCIGLILVLRLLTLSSPALTDPSESRYANMGQEMVLQDNWVTPQTYMEGKQVPFLGKPPLHAWLTALSLKCFGYTEFGARFPSFFADTVSAAVLGIFSLSFFGSEVAVLAVLLLLTSGMFFFLSGGCITDPVLGACITCSFVSFAFSVRAQTPEKKYYYWLFFLSLGLGMLSKGPVSIVIPGIGLLPWLIFQRKLAELKNIPWFSGLLIFVAVWAPWYVRAELANPGFLHYFFINENLLRYLKKDYGDMYGSGHRYPFGTIWLFLCAAFLPWTILLLLLKKKRALWSAARERFGEWFLYALAWGISPALLFTVAKQISGPYVMPGLPGISLFAALLIVVSFRSRHFASVIEFFRWTIFLSILLAVPLLFVGLFLSESFCKVCLAILLFIGLVALVYRYLVLRRSELWTLLPLACCSLAVVFSMAILSVGGAMGRNSTKEVITYVREQTPDVRQLAFFGRLPNSSNFYSQSQSPRILLHLLTPTMLAASSEEYLVVFKRNEAEIPEETRQKLVEVKRFPKWVIYKRL